MDSFEQKQTALQQELKQVCSSTGREMNLHQSAVILNNLGLLYRTKSPDKISLIQSAALLNAAIIRQPTNRKFQNDLQDLCEHVLLCANATHKQVSLVNIAKDVKAQFEKMRKNVRIQLNKIKKIPENVGDIKRKQKERTYIHRVKSLLLSLSGKYKKIMASVSQQCIQIMGQPPCKYTLVGMGSLAKDETTPYSDFEHILLLQNFHQQISSNESSQIKEYFRWYSALFHIIIINLKETILPSVGISCLNDTLTPGGDWFYDGITPSGISFDGMMVHACKFPLGRTQKTEKKPWTIELIKPVDEMVKYLEDNEDLKNGYKLGDILTKTCYIDGDEKMYEEFRQKVKSTLEQNQAIISNIENQLYEDLENFDIVKNIKIFGLEKSTNIKRIIYRSITLFIAALGRLRGLDEDSSFDIIDKFQSINVIDEMGSHRLSHAVAVACHIRLFHYMLKKRQEDTIYKENDLPARDKVEELTKAVNKSCLVKCIVTASVLQTILKNVNEINNFGVILDQVYVSQQLCYFNALGLYKEGISFGERHLNCQDTVDENYFLGCNNMISMYDATGQYEKSFALKSKLKGQIPNEPRFNDYSASVSLSNVGDLFRLRKYSQVIRETNEMLKTNFHPTMLTHGLLYSAQSKMMLNKFHEALSALRDVKKNMIYLNYWNYSIVHGKFILAISQCLIGTGRVQQGLHMAREGLNGATGPILPKLYKNLIKSAKQTQASRLDETSKRC